MREYVDEGVTKLKRVGRRGGVTDVCPSARGALLNKRPRGHRKVIPGVCPSAPSMASVGDGVVLARGRWQSTLHAPSVKKCDQYGDGAGEVVALRLILCDR